MDPATSMYYLYSTLAQTLASAAGLLAAVAIYKIPDLEDRIAPVGDVLVSLWADMGDENPDEGARAIWAAWRKGDFKKVVVHLEIDQRWLGGRQGEYERFKDLVANYHQLRGRATLALATTFVVVAVSLVALSIGHSLPPEQLRWWLMGGPILFGLCFLTYVRVGRSLRLMPRGHASRN